MAHQMHGRMEIKLSDPFCHCKTIYSPVEMLCPNRSNIQSDDINESVNSVRWQFSSIRTRK
jgi:hypothetical protein